MGSPLIRLRTMSQSQQSSSMKTESKQSQKTKTKPQNGGTPTNGSVSQKEDKRRKTAFNRLFVDAYKRSQRCKKCGEKRSALLTFHHRDPNQKQFNLSACKARALRTVKAEIAKCDILCSNCHILEHCEWVSYPAIKHFTFCGIHIVYRGTSLKLKAVYP